MKTSAKKRILMAASVLLALCLSAALIVTVLQSSRKPVKVAPVNAMSSGFGGSSPEISSYGNIASGSTQEISYDDSLTITKIYVHEGDNVRIGDPLISYDTTLAALELEMKQMQIDGIGLNIRNIRAELEQLKKTSPVASFSPNKNAGLLLTSAPGETTTAEPPEADPISPGNIYGEISADSVPYQGTGTQSDPFRFYVFPPEGRTSVSIGGDYLKKALSQKTCAVFDTVNDPESPSEIVSSWTMDWGMIQELSRSTSGSSLPEEAAGVKVLQGTVTDQDQPYTGDGTLENPFRFLCAAGSSADHSLMSAAMESGSVYQFDIVDNQESPSSILYSWTLDGRGSQENHSPDDELPPDELPPDELPGDTDIPSGPTAEDLKSRIREKEEALQSLELEKRTSELELYQLQKKVENGTVKSTVNGTVRSVTDSDTARLQGTPLITVSGEEGFYVTGYVAETALTKVKPGMTLSVSSWTTGMSYEATVTGVSVSPSSGYSGGNPGLSYYPFTAVIKDDAQLKNGEGVDLSGMEGLEGSEENNSLFLPSSLVRQEGNRSYVYKKNENSRLIKQYVETGRISYGSVEIRTGLQSDDEIAFPYGRDVKEGARTRSVDTLYDYGN